MRPRTMVALFCVSLVMALEGCEIKSGDPGGRGSTPLPVVKIKPWTPAPPGNPVVLSVSVSGKDGYAFVDSGQFANSQLVVIAKDGSNVILGSATQAISVTGWADGTQTVKLTEEQAALTTLPKMAKLVFGIAVLCQSGTAPAVKLEDTSTYVK
jgi:hypothetical protein